MQSLHLVAGFICYEGQRSADTKQFVAMAATAIVLAIAIRLLHRRFASRVLFGFLIVGAVLAVFAVGIIGPFFFSDWGCDNALLELVVGDGY